MAVSVAALATLLVDQASKAAVRAVLPLGASHAMGDWLRLSHVENSGIAFVLLRRQPRLAAGAAGLASALLLAVVSRVQSRSAALGAGLMLGGWSGNALDRIRRGTVTDFLDLGAGDLRWPAFNLADTAILCGAALLARALR